MELELYQKIFWTLFAVTMSPLPEVIYFDILKKGGKNGTIKDEDKRKNN